MQEYTKNENGEMVSMNNKEISPQRYRKDAVPKDTIQTIKTILSSVGIRTVTVSEHSYKTNWFSVQLEIEGLPGVGANGKGTTKDLAVASALGELMERLQSEQLLEAYYRFSPLHAFENSRGNMKCRKADFVAINSLYAKNAIASRQKLVDERQVAYLKVNSGEYELLPDSLISYVCGSNGTCAGNTVYEALGQGMAEIIERYVLKKIINSDKGLELPTVSEEVYKGYPCYTLIEAIKEKGYTVLVKDCTLQGQYPVLGVLIVNPKTAQYKFSIGCDFDADICIQRCITEMFQGYDFDLVFRRRMLNLSDTLNRNSILSQKLNNPHSEFVNCAIDESGYLPIHIFASTTINTQIEPFFGNMTNVEIYKQFLKLFLHNGCEVYIRDCSFLGFPTFRIYIPGYSDVFYQTQEDAATSYQMIEKLKMSFYEENHLNKFKNICGQIQELQKLDRYNKNIPNNRLHGIILNKTMETNWLDDSDTIYVEAAIKSNNLDSLLSSINGNSQKHLWAYMNTMFKVSGTPPEKKEACMSLFQLKKSSEAEKKFPECSKGCLSCYYKDECAYEYWKQIFETLQRKRREYLISSEAQCMANIILDGDE